MSWLIPFLRPLVPVAVDYARARIQTAQRQAGPGAPEESEISMEPIEMRLADAEAQVDALANVCNELGDELARFSAEANAHLKSARTWGMLLLVWNLALTITVVVLFLR